jgi:hypothetical protein
MLRFARRSTWASALFLIFALAGCEDSTPTKNPFEPPPDQPKKPPPYQPQAEPAAVPDLAIDAIGPKVGFNRIAFQHPDAKERLAAELTQVKDRLAGKQPRLRVDRKAKRDWVVAYLTELGRMDFSRVVIVTETREEYPKELTFTPEVKLGSPPPCSPVAMILSDRSTAVWKLSGGVAGRRPKGMAGPDLTMTGDTLERVAKACKGPRVLLVSAGQEIEWGLLYDLAASSRVLGVHFDAIALLSEEPVPGHPVELSSSK